ncbi:unnamed protein product [Alternaria burnsii]|jgi:hypothetical protein|nr:unnamed protein product [Alternaria burnsii]
MSQVEPTLSSLLMLSADKEHEDEQTANDDFEYISYRIFGAVTYDRVMFWKPGNGKISVGKDEMTSQNTSEKGENVILSQGQSVAVGEMWFRLVRKV